MTTLHTTNIFNVKTSINAAFLSALNAFTLPSYMVQPAVVFNWPEIEASLPCFSIVHMPSSSSDKYQGRTDGANTGVVESNAMLEVSAWVSRDQKSGGQDVWAARLSFMEAMINAVHASTGIVLIRDYATSLTAPALTGYKVNLRNLTFVQVAEDPNPAIERRRALITYWWSLRA